MKYLNRLFFLSVLAIAAVQGRAQTPVHVKPEISYTQDHARYILGGLVVEGDKNYDEDVLTSISGLTVGQMYDVPGEDISEAIRRYKAKELLERSYRSRQYCGQQDLSAHLSARTAAGVEHQLWRREEVGA